ncbi:hypothetical protein A5671_21700 [Mycolicibacter heraklionensis]|nr:hypothetical protein A5671_21700 [Mycolicibacter heraklionensis]
MNTAYSVPLPPGADPRRSDLWEDVDGVPLRQIWSVPMPLPETIDVDVRVVCTQAGDGHIITGDPNEPVAIHWEDTGYSPAVARQVAAAILEAADLADQWGGES